MKGVTAYKRGLYAIPEIYHRNIFRSSYRMCFCEKSNSANINNSTNRNIVVSSNIGTKSNDLCSVTNNNIDADPHNTNGNPTSTKCNPNTYLDSYVHATPHQYFNSSPLAII